MWFDTLVVSVNSAAGRGPLVYGSDHRHLRSVDVLVDFGCC